MLPLPRGVRVLLPLLLLALVTPAPSAASPDDASRETARTIANQAADALARGEHARAEQLLAEAYRAYPAPTIALLQARTLVRLSRLAAALGAYERAAAFVVNAESPVAFQRAVADARSEHAQLLPRVPRLLVALRGKAAGSAAPHFSLDGETLPSSQLGRWMRVDPGQRIVRIQVAGMAEERTVRLAEGQAASLELEVQSADRWARWATVGALGVGVVGLGVGVVSGLMGAAAHDDASAVCPDLRCPADSEAAEDVRDFRWHRTVSTVGYGVGAVGLGVGGFLLLRGSFDGPELRVEVDRVAALRATP